MFSILTYFFITYFFHHDSLEEDGSDTQVMSLREALQRYEAGGLVEYTLGGHHASRSAGVQQGREPDAFQIAPDASNALAWKANNVPSRSIKAANVASVFPWPLLEASPMQMVPWLVHIFSFQPAFLT